MDVPQTTLPKIARVAYTLAFIFAASTSLSLLIGQVLPLFLGAIPLLAGIEIKKGRAWGAFGLATYFLFQLLLLPFVVIRTGGSFSFGMVFAVILQGCLAGLFWWTGKTLRTIHVPTGRAWPWIIVSALTTFPLLFVQAFSVPTGSMENTLLIGDRVLVRTVPKPSIVQRGDIVVFRYPVDRSQTYVKRVVAVAGDRIQLVDKQVVRNGQVQKEPYAANTSDYVDNFRDNFPADPDVVPLDPRALDMLKDHVVNGEVVVPPGQIFVLGDNRDHSLDSRYFGFVGQSDIIGKPFMIYGSTEPLKEGTPASTPGLFRTRWGRLLKRL